MSIRDNIRGEIPTAQPRGAEQSPVEGIFRASRDLPGLPEQDVKAHLVESGRSSQECVCPRLRIRFKEESSNGHTKGRANFSMSEMAGLYCRFPSGDRVRGRRGNST